MKYEIGCAEFANIIGADHSDVSRAASNGILTVVASGANRRGPGSSTLDRAEAERIAAAVECGIPWRVAAKLGDNLEVFSGGVIVRRPVRQ